MTLAYLDVGHFRVHRGGLRELRLWAESHVLAGPVSIFVDETERPRYFLLDQTRWSRIDAARRAGENLFDLLHSMTELTPVIEELIISTPAVVLDEELRVVGAWLDESDLDVATTSPLASNEDDTDGGKTKVFLPDHRRWEPAYMRAVHLWAEGRGAAPDLRYLHAAEYVGAGLHVVAGRPHPLEAAEAIERRATSLTRTPHLHTPQTLPTKPGSTFEVTVHLDSSDQPIDLEDTTAGVFDLPENARGVAVDIEVVVSDHFDMPDHAHRKVRITRDDAATEPEKFTIQVADRPPNRPAGLIALVTYRGRPAGHVSRVFDWHNEKPHADEVSGTFIDQARISFPVDAEASDLTVVLLAPGGPDGVNFTCSVRSPHLDEPVQTIPFALPARAPDYVEQALNSLLEGSDEQRFRSLNDIGLEFWRATPQNFQDAFWALIEAGAPLETILISSQEGNLPWELMTPHRGALDEYRPLGVDYAIGRWIAANAVAPPQHLPIVKSAVIAPKYSDARALPAFEKEAAFVCDHVRGERVSPSTCDGIDHYCNDHAVSLIHFVGHGRRRSAPEPEVPDGGDSDEVDFLSDIKGLISYDGTLELERHDELPALHLYKMPGLREMFRRQAPVVFLNACEVGALTPSLIGASGFPQVLIEIGARALIAPLWSVLDSQATEVARRFYTESLAADAPSAATVLRNIRAAAYEAQDADTYAAYVFYGDPRAKLTLANLD